LLHAQDPRFGEAMKRLLAEGQWQGELLPQTKQGKAVLVESRWTLVTDAKGKPISILCINTDITERKKLEVQFLRAQRMESIGTLAGGIAHDLNNVLTPILVAAQVLQMHVSSKEDRMLLETVEKSALHGAALLKQVLLFARGAEGEHTALRIQHLVGELEKLLRETFPRSIEIRTRIGKDTWVIKGDATQLNQVLMNLCVNARDAMPKGGQLEIRAKNLTPGDDFFRAHPDAKPGAYLMLSVQDTGCGIPPEVLERIFDPFFTTKELGKGTGLGLSTVLGIVRSHGGVLQVQSEVGKGTRFDIYLPALPTEATATVPPERPALPRGQGQGVLVIDDEPYIREVISSMLRFCNYRSFPAAGGQAGIDLYREKVGEIELALVDMMMPGIDGATTMKRLRQINPHLPMIAVSGMLEESQLGDDSELKGVELLRKPITAEVLLNRIAAVLSAEVR
jgi:two-component system, cell cycle sensor histidine kinase and response regulator CckA